MIIKAPFFKRLDGSVLVVCYSADYGARCRARTDVAQGVFKTVSGASELAYAINLTCGNGSAVIKHGKFVTDTTIEID